MPRMNRAQLFGAGLAVGFGIMLAIVTTRPRPASRVPPARPRWTMLEGQLTAPKAGR